MHQALASLVLVVAVLPPLVASVPLPTGVPGFVLNEFLAGPARDWDGNGVLSTRDDEWVEVHNGGAATLDLSCFLLTDSERVPRFAFSGTLEPGGRVLVFGSDAYAWEKAAAYPAYGLSLANTGDTVMLWQVVEAETLLVDSYAYGSHEAAADRAVGRAAGIPIVSHLHPIHIGADVQAQFKNDQASEEGAVKAYNEAVKLAYDLSDGGTRILLESILKDEEEHLDWLEMQNDQISHMGFKMYLVEQTD